MRAYNKYDDKPVLFHYALPSDTRKKHVLTESTKGKHNYYFTFPRTVENFYLMFNKYGLPLLENQSREKFIETKSKLDFFRRISSDNTIRSLLNNSRKFRKTPNWQGVIPNTKQFNLYLKNKMVVGLGSTHIYETGIILDFLTGIPYIPGSALKGITRNAYVLWWAENLQDENIDLECLDSLIDSFEYGKWEKEGSQYIERMSSVKRDKTRIKLQNETVEKINLDIVRNKQSSKVMEAQLIFGTQKKSGGVIFFDAYPEGDVKIEADIMNPHYFQYYEDKTGKTPPTDYQSPIPIPFLVVKNTSFTFTIAVNYSLEATTKMSEDEKVKLLDNVEKFLKLGLTEYTGIGAKTALGYGYFKNG